MINWITKRSIKKKPLISKDLIKYYKDEFKPNFILMIVMAILYIGILYKCGIASTFTGNLDLIKYIVISPLLISIGIVDFKEKIIPNRLVLTTLEIGLIFTFLYGIYNVAISFNMIFGMIIGGGIFLFITLVGALLSGKGALGMGDVKLIAVIGLCMGVTNIIAISILSFFIGAIVSLILLIIKIKKIDDYVSFGPFIIISTIIMFFVPYGAIISILLNVFTLGKYSRK